jgi:hypothetical protein
MLMTDISTKELKHGYDIQVSEFTINKEILDGMKEFLVKKGWKTTYITRWMNGVKQYALFRSINPSEQAELDRGLYVIKNHQLQKKKGLELKSHRVYKVVCTCIRCGKSYKDYDSKARRFCKQCRCNVDDDDYLPEI